MSTILLIVLVFASVKGQSETPPQIEIFDLTNPTTWQALSEYYMNISVAKKWKICYSCGFPKMGTTIHYLYYGTNPMKPAAISVNYLMTRLVVIDLSSFVKTSPNFVLQMDDAKRWFSSERETFRPTLLLFKFGWTKHPEYNHNTQCICQIPDNPNPTVPFLEEPHTVVTPNNLGRELHATARASVPSVGENSSETEMYKTIWVPWYQDGLPADGISYEVAAHISINLGHVVGVGTDTPSLETWESRHTPAKTVSGLLGKSGIYILENVAMTSKIPEKGCLAIVMPLKLSAEVYVPARLTAVCPPQHKETVEIILAQSDARVA